MKFSIRSFLARVANRNSLSTITEEETGTTTTNNTTTDTLTSDNSPMDNNSSSDYRSVLEDQSTQELISANSSLDTSRSTSCSSSISTGIKMEKTRRRNKSLTMRQRKKFSTKRRRAAESSWQRIKNGYICKQKWEAEGMIWKTNPTPLEKHFVICTLDLIAENGPCDLSTDSNVQENSTTFEEEEEETMDLKQEGEEGDENCGVCNQFIVSPQCLMEGSPFRLYSPDIAPGILPKRRQPMQFGPVNWKAANPRKSIRFAFYDEPELAVTANEVVKSMTSDEIQKMFGLSDAGSIILNVDHIDVVQGKCGFNRGKASRRFMVPLAQEAMKRDRMQDIRRKWNKLFDSYSLAIGNIFGHPRNKQITGGCFGGPGDAVSAYALSLAQDATSTFSRNIENFIACTKESREMSPQIMMRNMRQFMSGMKNYLVKHGEGDFHQEVQKACGRLKADEFLNLDTILEGVMHKLVVLPLREHLYGLFVDFYSKTNDIQLLVENVKFALGKSPVDIGIRKEVQPPTDQSMRSISLILQRLQEAELPLEKLDHLMAAVSTIFASTGCPKGQALNADDFLPLLVYVVAKTGFVGAEIEAEFMWGLLQPSLLSGEAGYYLTALCSAVHVLKTFKESQNEDGTGTIDWRSSSMPACSSVLRVIIPDEYNGSLQTRTLPVRPHTTTKEVCRIIAHKARITNPQDYGLFQLVDGEETLLTETDCPQEARLVARGKHCLLAYKRIDAKIAWPMMGSAGFH